MSDWRECELERIGGTVVGRVGASQDEATAFVGEWVVRWGWGNGVRVAKKWPGIEPGHDSFSYDFWGSAVVASDPNAATGDDVLRLLAKLDSDAASELRARVGHVEVFDLLDGGPVECDGCVTAWRPCLSVCPVCGRYLALANRSFKPGMWNTERARRIYKAQRRDDAPSPHSAAWPAWIAEVLR